MIANVVLTVLITGATTTALPAAEVSLKVIGGIGAEKGEFPHLVLIKHKESGSIPYCGASIVNENWIVTSAQCATSSTSGYILVAGEHNLETDDGSEQTRTVNEIVVHPNFNLATYANDIAVMKVNEPFKFDDYVQPAKLPTKKSESTAEITVAGWGTTDFLGNYPSSLMKVTVPIVSKTHCQNSYGTNKILPGMLCAGISGKDACQGDTGSGAVADSTLIGLVSWGYGCASDVYPGVYTDVEYFKNWIKTKTT